MAGLIRLGGNVILCFFNHLLHYCFGATFSFFNNLSIRCIDTKPSTVIENSKGINTKSIPKTKIAFGGVRIVLAQTSANESPITPPMFTEMPIRKDTKFFTLASSD
jgi:hypothetical protein